MSVHSATFSANCSLCKQSDINLFPYSLCLKIGRDDSPAGEVIMSRMVSKFLLTGMFLLFGVFAVMVAPSTEAKNPDTAAGPLPAPTTPLGTPDPAPANRRPPDPLPVTRQPNPV